MNIDHLTINEAIHYEVPVDPKNYDRFLFEFESNHKSNLDDEVERLNDEVVELKESCYSMECKLDLVCEILSTFKDQLSYEQIEEIKYKSLESQIGIEE
jgi:hypothetical protein